MKRLRKIRSWGNVCVVVLTKFDLKDLELKEGDEVDISELKKENKKFSYRKKL